MAPNSAHRAATARTWIKICGMTSQAAVEAALLAGVDAIGFVFAPSVRRVTPAQAAEFASAARGVIPCVAVMQHPTQAEVDEVLATFAPDMLQTDAGDLDTLALPPKLARLPVLRAGKGTVTPRGGRFVFEGPVSGTGVATDWQQAARLTSSSARLGGELVLAGGLRPENVGEAIRVVTPFGVDVSSGVEERPGVKSSAKIVAFVAAVRAARSADAMETNR